jgi:hypothetical protein
MESREESKGRKPVVEALDEAADVLTLLDKAKRGAESDLTDDVVCHVSGLGLLGVGS